LGFIGRSEGVFEREWENDNTNGISGENEFLKEN